MFRPIGHREVCTFTVGSTETRLNVSFLNDMPQTYVQTKQIPFSSSLEQAFPNSKEFHHKKM
jgi:hypothetical protein